MLNATLNFVQKLCALPRLWQKGNMKLLSLFVWMPLLAALPLAGCASNSPGLVLAPVGPPVSNSPAVSASSLVVFSAFDQEAHFNDLPYRRVHSDYRILTTDGKLLQTVHNDNGTAVGGPKEVHLPAGRYQVVARANGYGAVTVPVVIETNQTTTVHLEGGKAWGGTAPAKQTNPVRLPDGGIVGWRADARRAGQTAPPAAARYHHEVISEFNEGETKFLQLVPDKNP